MQTIIDQAATQNAQALNRFQHACSDRLTANERNRDMQLLLTPKPVAELTSIVRQVTGVDGTIYVWQEDGDPVGVCPDLPPVAVSHAPIAVPATVQNAPAGDVLPLGYVLTDGQGARGGRSKRRLLRSGRPTSTRGSDAGHESGDHGFSGGPGKRGYPGDLRGGEIGVRISGHARGTAHGRTVASGRRRVPERDLKGERLGDGNSEGRWWQVSKLDDAIAVVEGKVRDRASADNAVVAGG